MDRRTFVASGAGGVVALIGAGELLTGGSSDGPDYGSIATPKSSGSVTLENGRTAALYAHGRIALFGAALVSQYTGVPAVVGRLKNVSGTTIGEVRVRIQFFDAAGAVLVEGWLRKNDLPAGQAWQFVADYPNDDPKNIATARVAAVDVA